VLVSSVLFGVPFPMFLLFSDLFWCPGLPGRAIVFQKRSWRKVRLGHKHTQLLLQQRVTDCVPKHSAESFLCALRLGVGDSNIKLIWSVTPLWLLRAARVSVLIKLAWLVASSRGDPGPLGRELSLTFCTAHCLFVGAFD
jgi:hypothetical protein